MNFNQKVGVKMGMLLTINAEIDFLHVTATGKFSLEEAKSTFLKILDAVVHYNTQKVLFDGRELIGEPLNIERFYYGEFAALETFKLLERGVSFLPQFAYILIPPILDPKKFGETVAVNRGMNVKTHDNFEEAIKWLGLSAN